jgi:hypothetical protein
MTLLGLGALFILLGAGCSPGGLPDFSGREYPALEKVAYHPLEARGLLEPSGLVMVDGTLYTVADKDNRRIFRVAFGKDSSRLEPAVTFEPPASGTMDWEGITADGEGNFYLISEWRGRLLRVTPSGEATWVTPDLRPEAKEQGLFAKRNAGFEGVTWLGPGHFLGAVEREPRGLVEWREAGGQTAVLPLPMNRSPFQDALPLLRIPDFSALASDGERTFAIFRNAHLLVRLERTAEGGWTETDAWSFRHLETDPQWAFQSQTYGQVEGLAVEGRDIWLILDNNLGTRQADPSDRRPLLIHARFPAGGK